MLNKAPSQAENAPHQYTYKPTPYPEQDTVITSSTSSEAQEAPVPVIRDIRGAETPGEGQCARDPPRRIDQACPAVKALSGRPNPTWSEIIDAADWLRHDLDVSKPLWGEACLTMGRDLAAVALAIVSTKEPEHFRTTPGGYFRGMVQKAKAGELHLERTVWAMRRATQPDARPRKGRGGGRYQDDWLEAD